MVDKVKIEPKIIVIHRGRPSFLKAITPAYRTDKRGQPVKTRPDGSPVKPRYSLTWLLDPSDAQAQATIKEIKAEAVRQLDLFFGSRADWPKDNPTTGTKGVLLCFGNGNDLAKVYDGYKDMFYIKASDTTPPIIGDRKGRQVQFGTDNAWHVIDKATNLPTDEIVPSDQVPYGGAYCRGRISLYVYNNEQAGVNSNFRSAQFLEKGPAFGGGGVRNVKEELAEMAGDAPGTAAAQYDDDIPF
jgi:hypothetical protein